MLVDFWHGQEGGGSINFPEGGDMGRVPRYFFKARTIAPSSAAFQQHGRGSKLQCCVLYAATALDAYCCLHCRTCFECNVEKWPTVM